MAGRVEQMTHPRSMASASHWRSADGSRRAWTSDSVALWLKNSVVGLSEVGGVSEGGVGFMELRDAEADASGQWAVWAEKELKDEY